MEASTIAAIATPSGTGGIGIIKLSGPQAIEIARGLFCPAKKPHRKNGSSDSPVLNPNESHRLIYGHIIDPKEDRIIDEALISIMRAPHTYTREDVVEINVHSGPVILKEILRLILQNGARLAQPGEFTKRAYLNGRIDLSQAEAVIEVINARTEIELKIVARQINGEMGRRVENIRHGLKEVLSMMEAGIDFCEEDETEIDTEQLLSIMKGEIIPKFKRLIRQYAAGHIYREGFHVVIVGKPNVGKSSLMNTLLQKDRVIISPLPGTTRDTIEETLNIAGIPVVIVDTAGLHETDDPLELIGIKKVREYIERANLVLFVIDISEPLGLDDLTIYSQIKACEILLIQNKKDLVPDRKECDLPAEWEKLRRVKISALYQQGLEALKGRITQIAQDPEMPDPGSEIIPNMRQKVALEKGLQAVQAARKAVEEDLGLEIGAIEIKAALKDVGEIVGDTATEEILDQIFSRFCIGK